jgi:hypothetical protein
VGRPRFYRCRTQRHHLVTCKGEGKSVGGSLSLAVFQTTAGLARQASVGNLICLHRCAQVLNRFLFKFGMPTTNIVEAVLGRKHLKWDALWRLFSWLLDPKQGHGLGEKIVERFCLYTFGQSFPSCPIKLEYQLSPVKDGKGKWADLAVAIPSFDAPTHVAIMDDTDRNAPGSRQWRPCGLLKRVQLSISGCLGRRSIRGIPI